VRNDYILLAEDKWTDVTAYSSRLIGAHDGTLVAGTWKMGLFVQHPRGSLEPVSMAVGLIGQGVGSTDATGCMDLDVCYRSCIVPEARMWNFVGEAYYF
jgi:hypothetical protein